MFLHNPTMESLNSWLIPSLNSVSSESFRSTGGSIRTIEGLKLSGLLLQAQPRIATMPVTVEAIVVPFKSL